MSQTLMSRPATHVAPELTERCDRCGAAAKLSVTLAAGGDLAFCGHHGNRHSDDIVRVAERIVLEDGYEWAGK